MIFLIYNQAFFASMKRKILLASYSGKNDSINKEEE